MKIIIIIILPFKLNLWFFSIVIIFYFKFSNNYINNIKHVWLKFLYLIIILIIRIIVFSNLLIIVLVILIIMNIIIFIIILNMFDPSLSGSDMLARPTVVGSGRHARPTFFPLIFFFSAPIKKHVDHSEF